jgi:hypothetical protein
VTERVTRFEPRSGQDLDVEDPTMTGAQRLRFAPGAVALELDYRLKGHGRVLDLLFVRRAMRDSLRRTVDRFALEVEGGAESVP